MAEQSAVMKGPDPVQAHCPTCNAERTCDVHGHVYKSWSWEDREGRFSVDGGVDHSLLECRGCHTVFYLSDSWDSEFVETYRTVNGDTFAEPERNKRTFPAPDTQSRPLWLDAIANTDKQLQSILNEVYVAYDNHAYILMAVGLRTALDTATEVLGIDPAKTFAEKLGELQAGGWVGSTEHDILDVITNAGSAAAHRGWSPSKEDAGRLLTAMEAFLHRAFIVGQDALKIRANIPAKPKRRAASSTAKEE